MPAFTRNIFRTLFAFVALQVFVAAPAVVRADEITIFAAASLKNALDAIAADWQNQTGNTAAISYGGSSALAKQIQEGAPADIFVSASSEWMDTLEAGGQIKPHTRRDLLGNTLVLVAHGKPWPKVEIAQGFDLAALLGDGKLAMALVDSVPAGQYGKQSLESLGIWGAIEPSVAQTENVRAALALVATGEAPFGIVYFSDAVAATAAGEDVSIVGTFPADSHKPIIYPVAVTTISVKPEALAFLDALSGGTARSIFADQGFVVLK